MTRVYAESDVVKVACEFCGAEAGQACRVVEVPGRFASSQFAYLHRTSRENAYAKAFTDTPAGEIGL